MSRYAAKTKYRRADGRQPYAYRPLVRAMFNETSWLENPLRWRNGGLSYRTREGWYKPGQANLEQAGHLLEELGRRRNLLPQDQARLEQRRATLRLLNRLDWPEAPFLPDQSRALARMLNLLIVEALCLDPLPVAPSALLFSYGEGVLGPLENLIGDETLPLTGRALAALLYGALQAEYTGFGAKKLAAKEGWLQRAYRYGWEWGLPQEAALLVGLLAAADGINLGQRYAQAVSCSPNPFRFRPAALREMLAEGVNPLRLVELVEALEGLFPLAEQLWYYRDELPELRTNQRRRLAEKLRQERKHLIRQLAEVIQDYLRASLDPTQVDLLLRLSETMLGLGGVKSVLAEGLIKALRLGLTLPPKLQRPYLEILVGHPALFWTKDNLKKEPDAKAYTDWLDYCYNTWLVLVAETLNRLGEGEVIDEFAKLGALYFLRFYPHWRDPYFYRLIVVTVREFQPGNRYGLIAQLGRMLNALGTRPAIQLYLRPLLDGMRNLPPEEAARKGFILENLLSALPTTRQGTPEALVRVLPYLKPIGRVALHTPDHNPWRCNAMTQTVLRLTKALRDPTQAEEWLNWLVNLLDELHKVNKIPDFNAVPSKVELALALAQGDFKLFQACARALITYDYDQDEKEEAIDQSVKLLERFSALATALAQILPRQLHRTLKFLVRLGLAAHLKPETLEPFNRLAPDHPDGANDWPEDWQKLFEVAPQLTSLAMNYRHVRQLLEMTAEVPAGVRQALDYPEKLRRELAHLEQLVTVQEQAQTKLLIRITNLRGYLAQPEQLTRQAVQQAEESLQQINAQTQLAAAEQQLLQCYELHLRELARPLKGAVQVDNDLLNALMLLNDVSQNRRLLLRLVRAYARGEHAWLLQLPANQKFLRELAERGVGVESWLSAYPRTFPAPQIAGGELRLQLESDPFHVLQMGNYFATCLSVGGCNSFSTIANACELNKRVIYARDGKGRVVARKLIGINQNGALIGFDIYNALSDKAAQEGLAPVFRQYCLDFAARCNLSVADEGEIPTLLAQNWYDDGAVAWTPPANDTDLTEETA